MYIAPDLPGFGGSDSLGRYGPDEMLSALVEFIVAMRFRYLNPDSTNPGKVIIVAHDWGAILALRLASEVPLLADRFIVANGYLPSFVAWNVEREIHEIRRHFMLRTAPKDWYKSAYNIFAFVLVGWRKVFNLVVPLMRQLSCSSYTYIFRLPRPLPAMFLEMGDRWFLRYAIALAETGERSWPQAPTHSTKLHTAKSYHRFREGLVQHFAQSLGPNKAALDTKLQIFGDEPVFHPLTGLIAAEEDYSPSVKARVSRYGTTHAESLRLYRNGLATPRVWIMKDAARAAMTRLAEVLPESSRYTPPAVINIRGLFPRGDMILWWSTNVDHSNNHL